MTLVALTRQVMFFLKSSASAVFIVCSFLLAACNDVSTECSEETALTEQAITVPSGFVNILSATGVNVYQKNVSGGQPDFVTVVDLRYGSLKSLTGSVTGAPNGSVARKTMSAFWTDAVNANTSTRTAKVVVNGTYFSTSASPAPIAFGLKVGGVIDSYGYGLNEYPGLTKTVTFDSSGLKIVSITSYSTSTFTGSMPDVVGVLDTSVDKSKTSNVPRTFIGVADQSGDGVPETVLLYSTAMATQAWAQNVLSSFGAAMQAMLDGGGSSGMIMTGTTKVASGRTVPHAIAVYSGK